MAESFRKRCRRFHEPGQAHELTFSCYHRLPLLGREQTCRWLAAAINQARTELGFHLWAYVFMPEHVHLLLWPGAAPFDTSTVLWKIKQPVARRAIAFIRRVNDAWLEKLTIHRGDGKLEWRFWQVGGGYDRNLWEPLTAYRVVAYFHENPVRRGLVSRPEEWQWSSARWYAGIRPVPLEIDPTLPGAAGSMMLP
jgi:putative transposase